MIIVILAYVSPETTEKHRLRKKNSKLLNKKKKDPGFTSYNQQSDLAQNTNILDMVPDPDPSTIDLNIGPGPIHFKSWVKYFKFSADEDQGNKPRAFFKNLEFYQQSRKYPDADLNQKIEGQYKYIKNEMFFYMIVFYDRINILNSRIDKFQQTFESLPIDFITPVIEEKDFQGGITDFGAFAEGFCFKVNSAKKMLTQVPNGDTQISSWIICTETAVRIY